MLVNRFGAGKQRAVTGQFRDQNGEQRTSSTQMQLRRIYRDEKKIELTLKRQLKEPLDLEGARGWRAPLRTLCNPCMGYSIGRHATETRSGGIGEMEEQRGSWRRSNPRSRGLVTRDPSSI